MPFRNIDSLTLFALLFWLVSCEIDPSIPQPSTTPSYTLSEVVHQIAGTYSATKIKFDGMVYDTLYSVPVNIEAYSDDKLLFEYSYFTFNGNLEKMDYSFLSLQSGGGHSITSTADFKSMRIFINGIGLGNPSSITYIIEK